jgi:hypothetical protein
MKDAKISDKGQALMDTAKPFGRNIERREQKNVDEFEDMSAEDARGARGIGGAS